LSVVGIVTEYNPLHYGHTRHIQAARQLTGSEAVICVMSGSFTQRGEPALVNKWSRTAMALEAGVDLVFELPFVFAARSAYHFARGATLLLQKTGVVTHLCFGSELGRLSPLQNIAQVIHQEPDPFKQLLKKELQQGAAFPQARADALLQYFKDTPLGKSMNLQQILMAPNNILAIEYLRAILREQLDLIPITLSRSGSGYHQLANTELASATSIRQDIFRQQPLEEIKGIPPSTRLILQQEFDENRGPVDPDRMANLLRFCINRMIPEELAAIYDVTEGLENRILSASRRGTDLREIISLIKTRRYNYTRIMRVFSYILLQFTKQKAAVFDETGPLYFRLLGFSPQGQKILQEMKANSRLPVITKMGGFSDWNGPADREMLAFDWMATDLHALLQPKPGPAGLDFTCSPLRIEGNS